MKLSEFSHRKKRKEGALHMRVAGRGLYEMDYFFLAVAWKFSTLVNCC